MTRAELTLLRCTGCGGRWLTPAGSQLVAKGERCLRCDGRLVIDEDVDENLVTVERAWNTYLAGDVDGLVDEHDEDVEIQPVARHLTDRIGSLYRGHAGIRRCLEDCSDDWEMLPSELKPFGERVLTLGSLVKKGGQGESQSYAVAWVHRVENGKIVSFAGYLEPEDALRDLQPDALD